MSCEQAQRNVTIGVWLRADANVKQTHFCDYKLGIVGEVPSSFTGLFDSPAAIGPSRHNGSKGGIAVSNRSGFSTKN